MPRARSLDLVHQSLTLDAPLGIGTLEQFLAANTNEMIAVDISPSDLKHGFGNLSRLDHKLAVPPGPTRVPLLIPGDHHHILLCSRKVGTIYENISVMKYYSVRGYGLCRRYRPSKRRYHSGIKELSVLRTGSGNRETRKFKDLTPGVVNVVRHLASTNLKDVDVVYEVPD